MQLITGDDNKSIKMRVIERIEKAVALDIEEYESLYDRHVKEGHGNIEVKAEEGLDRDGD